MANLKFYMTPGSCSIGIHLLLEELGLFFEAHVIDLLRGDHLRPEYLAINPRGSVPALQLADGSALTDFISIARSLADTHPKRQLLPESPEDRARALRVMEYVIGVIHGEGFTRVFTSERYAPDPEGKKAAEGEGQRIVRTGFERLEAMITGPIYAMGSFSIVDAALFYVEFWAARIGMELPTRCQRHYQAMLQRPSVRQVLAEEGYHSVLRQYPS
ncbi:MAG TPA: glutathione S-transferase N-terminal domain-containing protein [Polyangiaceae bacterium]|nr:glutathione S-transferase N-terminal domain-containing protein [Polyangiaceae bacterium]